MMAAPIKMEIQHFEGCPNSQKMIKNTKAAIAELNISFNYSEILVETPEKAKETIFRGSPTLLVNGMDFEKLEEPELPSLACRYYKDGIPTIEEIKTFILCNYK